jgi:hypothetical protein
MKKRWGDGVPLIHPGRKKRGLDERKGKRGSPEDRRGAEGAPPPHTAARHGGRKGRAPRNPFLGVRNCPSLVIPDLSQARWLSLLRLVLH